MTRVSLLVVSAALAAAISLPAQIRFPGQTSPFPGGTGQPGGGGPIGGRGGGRGKTAPSSSRKEKEPVVTVTTTGMLRTVSSNQFVLEADDHRIITYRTGDRTKTLKENKPAELSSFNVADHLTVDATSDDEGYFTAVAVTFTGAGSSEERALAARTWDLPDLARTVAKPSAEKTGREKSDDDDGRPTLRRSQPSTPDANAKEPSKTSETKTEAKAEPQEDAVDTRASTTVRPSDPAPDADDPGRPQLRHGAQAPRATASRVESEPAAPAKPNASSNASANSRASSDAKTADVKTAEVKTASAPEAEPIPINEDPIIVKAKDAAADYSGTLPNFLVKQNITRYESDSPKANWQAHDVVTSDVVYKDGTETYGNIKVGSKSVKSMEETGGNWSTGEFASWLDDLFDPSSAAKFRRSGQESMNGRSTVVFKYEVTRERSHWRVMTQAQLYYPAYRGTMWVDRETSRVLRLEVEARGVPLLFPLDKLEMAMDYDFVRLATPKPFLLPTVAEVLTCQHGTSRCSRNRIEFRNYRKFGADSDITFDDKQ